MSCLLAPTETKSKKVKAISTSLQFNSNLSVCFESFNVVCCQYGQDFRNFGSVKCDIDCNGNRSLLVQIASMAVAVKIMKIDPCTRIFFAVVYLNTCISK